MRRALWVLPAVLLGLAAPAHSAPIVVSAGDVLTFNFDFAGVLPAPPYQFIQFNTGLGPRDSGEFGLWTGFSELDGGGSVIFDPHSDFLATLLPGEDGVFSMILSVVTGSYTVDPVAYGFGNGRLITDPVAPVSVTAAVPEPATLTLFGVGFAAAVSARRRRRRAR